MALDRPDDDFDDFDRPERQVPGGDVPARRPEPPESRSREEYYEVLRAASEGEGADASACVGARDLHDDRLIDVGGGAALKP